MIIGWETRVRSGSGRASNKVVKFRQAGIQPMRFAVLAVLILSLSVSTLAQQSSSYKVKRTAPQQRAAKSSVMAPAGKSSGSGTATASNAKELQMIEHQTAKTSGPAHPVSTKAPKAAGAIKPVQDKPNPPMNFNGTGGKNSGLTNRSANPYKGRLKQKNTGSQH
jgi:hypothetical protein